MKSCAICTQKEATVGEILEGLEGRHGVVVYVAEVGLTEVDLSTLFTQKLREQKGTIAKGSPTHKTSKAQVCFSLKLFFFIPFLY